MDMKIKKVSLLLGIVALGIVTSASLLTNSYNLFSRNEATTVQDSRRLYVYLEGDWTFADMFIHYWGGAEGTTYDTAAQMTKVVSDYWQGLYYFDIAMDVTGFLVRNASGAFTKNSDQSEDILVADLLVGTNYKAVAVKAWVADTAKRAVEIVDTAPGNSGQVAAILNHIDSCSTSYAGGYNAWPQLNDLFISPSTLDGTTVVTDNFGSDTTIAEKTAYLQTKYAADQAAI